MKRFLLVLAAIAPLGTGACNKPTQEDCRKAITHMEELLGTEATSRNADIDGEVRRCRGGSTKQAVACAIKARTPEELNACAFRGSKGKKADKDTAPPTPTPPAPTSTTPPSGAPSTSAPAPSAPSTTGPTPGAPPPGTSPPGTPPPGTPPPGTPPPGTPGK